MKFLFSIAVFALVLNAQAQEQPWNLFPGDDDDSVKTVAAGQKITGFNLDFNVKPGEVRINQDSRIDRIVAFLGEPQPGSTGVRISGYRVQLFFDSDKDQVNQKKADYLARHDEHPAYVDYRQPNFRLRVGNFRTRLQAQKWQDEMKIDFPDAIIVEDWIDLPELKTETK